MKNILQKSIGLVVLCILATSAYAQVSPKKFKKAKGIEVTYQNSYKGKVRPGEMIMKVSGDQVSLESVMPKMDPNPAEDGRPVYQTCQNRALKGCLSLKIARFYPDF